MIIDRSYIIKIRRELHRVPEIGYDLEKTLAIIRRELEDMKIPYTEEFGTSSIVAMVGPTEGYTKTIGIRADTDALPITEETGFPFASEHPGKMHACGHDCHAAMLLGTAKALKESEDILKCRVKLIFQAAEEARGGASRLCKDGVMKDIDMIIGAHVMPSDSIGKIVLNKACMNASSHSFRICVHGKSCHVSKPQNGVDAIAMANRIYTDIQIMRARETDPFQPMVVGIGSIHGGVANNVICDQVEMLGTIRAITADVDEFLYRRIDEICKAVSSDMGGSYELETLSFTPALHNSPEVAQKLIDAAIKCNGEGCIVEKGLSMGAEDFACYTLEKPGALMNVTTGPVNGCVYPLHNGKFSVDESALDIAPKIFCRFILDNME